MVCLCCATESLLGDRCCPSFSRTGKSRLPCIDRRPGWTALRISDSVPLWTRRTRGSLFSRRHGPSIPPKARFVTFRRCPPLGGWSKTHTFTNWSPCTGRLWPEKEKTRTAKAFVDWEPVHPPFQPQSLRPSRRSSTAEPVVRGRRWFIRI